LREVITVSGYRPPATHFYMTDVSFVPSVSALFLLAGFTPEARIVHTDQVVPTNAGRREFDAVMDREMGESQVIAAVVAERAAQLRVPVPHSHVMLVFFAPGSHSHRLLRLGPTIPAVNATPTRTLA